MASLPAASSEHRRPGSDDDDMDYELASEDSAAFSAAHPEDVEEGDEGDEGDETDEVEEGEAGEETTFYFDAEDGTFADEDGAEISFELAAGDGGDEDERDGTGSPQPSTATIAATANQPGMRTITMTPQQILQLLSQHGLRGVFSSQSLARTTRSQARRNQARHVQLADDGAEEEVEDDDDDDDYDEEEEEEDDDDDGYHGRYGGYGARRRRARPYVGDRYPRIPSETGRNLMHSGTFGTNDRCDHTACGQPFSSDTLFKRRKLSRRMLDRELGLSSPALSQRARTLNALASQDLVPSTSKADLIVNMNDRCYSGQFSEDGSFFFACGQDFRVRMYDTRNPYDWRYYKTVVYYGGQWTITDASLSPDNKLLAYSSIRPQVCLANTDQGDTSEPLSVDFSNMGASGTGRARSHMHFGIWSLRFSGDGAELVAGTGDHSVYVYDLEAGRSILRIPGHHDDVNAVCYGDRMSPHILYSGSDDTTLKVWDRRSLASMRPAGMFLGHTEGLTYIDSKGDGRYVISNAKDQTCKLWDLRQMISTDAGEKINPQEYTTNFDYRFESYDTDYHVPNPHDCSVVTFRGHRVLKTLIRCHFSPSGSTDGRYIYSGSHDGKVYIWNLDGTEAGQIDVNASSKSTHPGRNSAYAEYDDSFRRGSSRSIVRDCSWHPSAPVIAATSWSGGDNGGGTCTVHSWSDGAESDEVGFDGDNAASGEAYAKAASLGSAPMGARVTAQLQHDRRFYQTAPAPRTRQTGLGLGALWGRRRGDDDD